jgi:DNA-binding IclR family transcriptional regulator
MARERVDGPEARTPGAPSPTLQGVSRALRILDELALRPMKPAELSSSLGVPWATLHRALAQLEGDGFIQRDSRGAYRIGRKMWLLGSTYLLGHQLLEMAIPVLTRASTELPFAVLQFVEQADGDSVVLFSREAASGEVITRTTYGYHFPLHCGSKGLVLLAFAEPGFVDDYLSRPLPALTPETMTNPDEIRQTLDRIRRERYSLTVGDVQSFTGSVSSPVFDETGKAVACICAVVARSALEDSKRDRTVETVTRLAQSLSLGMGWQPVRHAPGSAVPQKVHQPHESRTRPRPEEERS